MKSHYDVAILGGGPAGSTAATILAKEHGRSVLVLEKEKFPRFKIGESLLPHSMKAFDRMGVHDKIRDSGFIEKFGANIVSASGEREVTFYFRDGFRSKQDRAYQVTRSDFDQILLDHAREHGAEVHEETSVEEIVFHPDFVEIRTKNAGGATETVRASYVIDCSGRNSVIGTKLNLRQPYQSLKKFSVFAHYEDVQRDAGIDGTLTRMVRVEDRWFWMIPLTEKRTSIGVVMDIATYKKLKMTPEQVLEKSLNEQPIMVERMKHAKLVTQIYTTGDYSYRNSALTGDRWMLAGDAAGFIDPVFSSGVFLAILAGETAADSIHRVMDHPSEKPKLFGRYERRLNQVMDIYLKFVNSWYTKEFMDIFLNPTERLQLASAVNSVLAGNTGSSFGVLWRLKLFYVCVYLQKYLPLVPRVSLLPKSA